MVDKGYLVGGWAYDYGDTPGQGRPYSSGINAAGAANLDKDKTRADQFVAALMTDAPQT